MGHFGDVLPSQSIGMALEKLHLTQQKINRGVFSKSFKVSILEPDLVLTGIPDRNKKQSRSAENAELIS